MDKLCFLNGQIMPVSEAKIGVYDIGMLRGYGVYDGLAAYNGKPFRFEDHMARFRNSAAGLKLTVPYSDAEIRAAIMDLLKANNQQNAIVRSILTGGMTWHGIEFDPAAPTFFILMEPFTRPSQEFYEKGGLLITHEYQRELSAFKTIHYIEAARMQEERKERGAAEVLFVSEGRALEASTSNFGVFIGDTLVTPARGVLGGITRKVALELAAPHYKIEERDLALDEAFAADEAFIMSSFKEILPIARIDDRTIGAGVPGPKTKHLMQLFAEYVKGY